MNFLLIFAGAILAALGLAMLGNRAGYFYFVIGPRSILFLATLIAALALYARGPSFVGG